MSYISALPSFPNFPQGRRVCLLGSTGSIGRSACRIMESWPDLFQVQALAGGKNLELLAIQARRWRPMYLAVQEEAGISQLQNLLPTDYKPQIFHGPEGYAQLARLSDVDMVLSAQVGAAGLRGTVAAAQAGKCICLANKESLVLAGTLIRKLCAQSGATLLPVDSEHYALFQCLVGRNYQDVRQLILTASGGPFREKKRVELANVQAKDALKHPNWDMGAKITIDSATLMNKGLEVIEACHLYGFSHKQVAVVVHPQSLVHSMVEMQDGSMLAQMSHPDMRSPIAGCMAWPQTLDATTSGLQFLDLAKAGTLTFFEPDEDTFSCLRLAREVLDRVNAGEDGAPVVLNAANEVAVAAFLQGRISFLDIAKIIEKALKFYGKGRPLSGGAQSVEDIEHLDKATRELIVSEIE